MEKEGTAQTTQNTMQTHTHIHQKTRKQACVYTKHTTKDAAVFNCFLNKFSSFIDKYTFKHNCNTQLHNQIVHLR